MKKYLITGISGFVAYHFLDLLNKIEKNCSVFGIDAAEIPDFLKDNIFKNINIQFTKIDLLDYSEIEKTIVEFLPTHIVHLASVSSVARSWEDPISSFSNNTNIFLNLAEIIRKNNIRCRFLSVGSSEEYGNVNEKNIPINENSLLNPISPYAIARVSQEMLSQCYASSYKLDIVITRSFNHIGPGQRDNFVIPSFVKQILNKIDEGRTEIELNTGDVSIIRDFTDVRDVVRAYYLLLEHGVSGEIYNVCSGTGRTLKEIISIISKILNVNITINIDNNLIRPNDNKIIIGDSTKIYKAVGWKPEISFENSINDIINYYKNNK